MHFWIDKRTPCGYTGRHRVPSSLSSGPARTRAAARKAMAAPVHRFTAVSTVECPPRRPHRSQSSNHYPRSQSAPQVQRRQPEESSLYVEIPPDPPQPTIASLAAARSVTPDTLLRTAALGLQHSPMMAPHLKFGMLVSFALSTLFLIGAKYYFDRQVIRGPMTAGEAGAMLLLVISVAVLSMGAAACRARRLPEPTQPDRVSSTAQRHARPIPVQMQDTSEETSVTSALAPLQRPAPSPSVEAPPPYHIAVLLPPREDSPPPPAYSAIS